MAPAPVTEDFYMILEVDQTATIEAIIRSYKRLALKHHPDRNAGRDTTAAFQLLGKAYETLRDDSKRRAYDLLYPTLKRGHTSPPTSRPPPASGPQPGPSSEALQITKLEKAKQERRERWSVQKFMLETAILKIRGVIRGLEDAIKSLANIAAAEAAEEAWKGSWSAWVLSPLYKQAKLSEEEKADKERKKQERRIEKDMKERRLTLKKTELEKQVDLMKNSEAEIDAADRVDDRNIRALRDKIWLAQGREREERQRQQREARRREEQEKAWRQKQEQEEREKRQRELAEEWKKQQREAAEEWERGKRKVEEILKKRQAAAAAAAAAAARRQQEEEQGSTSWRNLYDDNDGKGFSAAEACVHNGWWPKVERRMKCPQCQDTWNYLLECPGCKMKACPKCQSTIRPRRRSNNRW
ncbi:hypothetical protein F5B17DRAFT_239641 [Nemania serpens]|nr:hypothetical protein F5B17DRAFT_239641 [Nemania serpens]